jgi:anti-anti-sigma regulatory factor
MLLIFSGAITKNNLDSFLLVRKETLIKQNEGAFTFCFSRVDFIDPIGICLLASLFEDIADKNIGISLINLKLNIESYLTRMSFFTHFNKINYLDNTSHYRKNDKSKDLIELRKISDINKVGGVSAQLSKVVLGQIPDISNDDDPDGMIASEAERLSDNLEYVFWRDFIECSRPWKKEGV